MSWRKPRREPNTIAQQAATALVPLRADLGQVHCQRRERGGDVSHGEITLSGYGVLHATNVMTYALYNHIKSQHIEQYG